MFMITIAFRHDDEELIDIADLEKVASGIICRMKENPAKYYRTIEKYSKPMTQLEAGIHLNVTNCEMSLPSLVACFDTTESEATHRIVRARMIAKNFIKMDFLCEEGTPFRVNSNACQDTGILKSFRNVMPSLHSRTINTQPP